MPDAPDLLFALGAVLVIIAIAGALWTHRFGLSHLLVFLVVGMLAGVDGPLGLPFDDHGLALVVGNLALGLILFDGGLRTRWPVVRRGLLPAGLLATLGVVLTAAGVAAIAHGLLGLGWREGLLLGAALASTDASAVFAQFAASGLRLQRRVAATIEVESAMNDPMAMTLTVGLLALGTVNGAPATAASGGTEAALSLARMLVGHIGIGLVMGWLPARLAVRALRRLPLRDDHDGLLALLLMAFGILIFSLTNALQGSGFLAVYLGGLVLRKHLPRLAGLALPGLNGYTWLAQATMFLLLGLLVTPHEVWRERTPALWMAAGLMLLARPLAVAICLTPLRYGWREQLFIAWAGLRGAVPIVLATLLVVSGVDGAWRFFDIAFVVVLLSLLVQGPSLGPLARRLGLERQA